MLGAMAAVFCDELGSAGLRVMEAGRVETSLKTCLASKNLGSICFGARKP